MSLENPIIPLPTVRALLRLPDDFPDDLTLSTLMCQAVNSIETYLKAELEFGSWSVRWENFPADNAQELVFPGLNGLLEKITYTNPATNRTNTLSLLANTLPINYHSGGVEGIRRDVYIKAPATGWPAAVDDTVVTEGKRGYASGSLPFDLQSAVLMMTAKLESGIVDPAPDREVVRLLHNYTARKTSFIDPDEDVFGLGLGRSY